MSRLPLNQRLNGRVKRPKEVLSWSEGPGNSMHFDDRALRYYYLPDADIDREPRINLGRGFEAQKFDPDARKSVYLDNVLKAVMHSEKETGEKLAADAFTWRGLLTQLIIMSQNSADPNVLRDSFECLIVGFDNQVFISQDDQFVKAESSKPDTQGLQLMYSGYQFEHIACLGKPWGECSREEIEQRYRTACPIADQECYGILVKSGIGNVSLVYGAETDCVEGFKPSTNKLANYVELKTTRTIETANQAHGFERKLLRSWIQSFLAGVPKIVYGFRNDSLELQAVEEFKTDDLPKIIKNSKLTISEKKWNGNDAIGFYTILMQWIKDKVEDGRTYRLMYKAGARELLLMPAEIKVEGREVAFLSNEFVNWRRTISVSDVQSKAQQ